MALEVTGTVLQILPVQSGTSKAGKEWSKQEFVVETTDDQFPKKVCFTLFGDKISQIDSVSQGSKVTVSFNVESREFNGKWYHNINAWRIVAAQQAQAEDAPPPFVDDMPPPPPPPSSGDSAPVDDLPF